MKRIIVLITLCATLGYAKAQVCGCTDPRANNYNPQATVNDGSCTYASTTVSPYYSNNLSTRLNGTSGLMFFDGKLYTHNDHGDKKIFQIDTTDGHILDSLRHVDFEMNPSRQILPGLLYRYPDAQGRKSLEESEEDAIRAALENAAGERAGSALLSRFA